MAAMDLKRVDRMFRILPKEERYYVLFDELVAAVLEGCELLVEAFADGADLPGVAASLKEVERRGDATTREIKTRLQKSFVTPIDREDIDALAGSLDDILDDAYAAVSFADVTGLAESDAPLQELCALLLASAKELRGAVEHLNDRDGISEHCETVHRLETDADDRFKAALRQLFAGASDPLRVIRLKELYERVEGAVDRTEQVANILETIVVKNS
jgi:predicted phosphate transport protein (TIGR00153 family)